MNIQFGIWNFGGETIDSGELRRVESLLEPFAPDGIFTVQLGSLALMLGTLQTTAGICGLRPVPFAGGKWLLWDGRIDNRADLRKTTSQQRSTEQDAGLIADLYERLGVKAFEGIVGDWAAGICCESENTLILAKDYLGTRSLFYRVNGNQVAWSTVLEPLLSLFGGPSKLCESYIAGWMTFFPEDHLTPYQEIHSVPPSSFVRIQPDKVTTHRYSNVENAKPIRYSTDRQYEEHFLSVFREAVRRRIDSPKPILAELSGGMDSSSIVCMADSLLAGGVLQTPRIDTVTYCDATEVTWDEMPLVSKVETKRERIGHHMEIRQSDYPVRELRPSRLQVVPTSLGATDGSAQAFASLVSRGGHRVVLSGLGGDEIVGGVPTPIPELADLLARGHAATFLRRSMSWAIAKKKPVIALWRTTFNQFLPHPTDVFATTKYSWLTKEFSERNGAFLGFSQPRIKLFGRLPSMQANLWSLGVLRRQFACTPLASQPAYEWRYPFMDRDLVSYCFSIPREQLVRPHQRRSLMRRAFAGLVPREILERRRKAYVSGGLVNTLRTEWRRLSESKGLLLGNLGIANRAALNASVRDAEQGRDVPIIPLLRTLTLEHWLRNLYQETGPASVHPVTHDVPRSSWADASTIFSAEKN
jgi:asparagine synthase (glutamine-hydrolysing)